MEIATDFKSSIHESLTTLRGSKANALTFTKRKIRDEVCLRKNTRRSCLETLQMERRQNYLPAR